MASHLPMLHAASNHLQPEGAEVDAPPTLLGHAEKFLQGMLSVTNSMPCILLFNLPLASLRGR